MGLSDTASQAIHLLNFIIAQGYETGPAVIYQDNLSCMALIKRGGPGSERSRHINIRANVLTKPVQGAQFERKHKRELGGINGESSV